MRRGVCAPDVCEEVFGLFHAVFHAPRLVCRSEEKATAEADKTASKAEKEEGEDPSLWV